MHLYHGFFLSLFMLSRLPKNTFNFVRWKRASSGTTSDLPVSTLDAISLSSEYELTNNFQRARTPYYPAFLKNNNHLIHINLDDRISDASFANWRVDLYDMAGTEIDTALGTLTKCDVDGSNYRMYFTCNIDSGVSNGVYQMVIKDTTDNSLVYVSSCIDVISSIDIPEWSFLEFRNEYSRFNFDYNGVAGYNSLFIRANVVDRQPEGSLKQYVEQSTGIPRNQKSETNKVITLETMPMSDGDHDAMNALSFHDDIKLNGRKVTVKQIYKVENNRNTSRSKGVIEFFDQRYSTVNLNG